MGDGAGPSGYRRPNAVYQVISSDDEEEARTANSSESESEPDDCGKGKRKKEVRVPVSGAVSSSESEPDGRGKGKRKKAARVPARGAVSSSESEPDGRGKGKRKKAARAAARREVSSSESEPDGRRRKKRKKAAQVRARRALSSSSESEPDGRGEMKQRKETIGSRCSIKKMYKLISNLSAKQREYVEEIGFGGILELPQNNKTNREFLLWLYSNVDEEASSIVAGHRRDTPFYDQDVAKVMGIPCGGAQVPATVSDDVVRSVRRALGLSEDDHSPASVARFALKEPVTADEIRSFKMAFLICIVSYVLAPNLKNDYFVTDYWCAICDPDLIQMYNWAGYVRAEVLCSAARVKSELYSGKCKPNLTGCLPFLQAFYIDNLDTEKDGIPNLPHDSFPRIKVYDSALVNKIIHIDTLTRKGAPKPVYGRLLPKHPAAVCYQRNTSSRIEKNGRATGTVPLQPGQTEPSPGDTVATLKAVCMEKVSRFTLNCEELMVKSDRQIDEENGRHLKERSRIRMELRHLINLEAQNTRDEISHVCATVQQHASSSRRRRV